MRKTFLLMPMLWALMLVLFSCQKDVEKKNNNDQLISKVNNWLDKQKSVDQPNKAANIDILKENIDFSALRYEDLNVNERFIVMPIKDKYRIKKNIDNSTVPVLLLVMNTMGDIIRGNIVLFFPEDKKQMDKIPDNTFSKMYKEETINCNGLFRFLSPTGRWMYQREYKNGKLQSFGVVKPGGKAEARTDTDCTYYFLILTYWEDGVIVNQEAIYLGSICQGGCDDPMNQSLCPDGGGGGGGNSGEAPCCIEDPNAQITATVGTEKSWICGYEAVDPSTGNLTKQCTNLWSFEHFHLLWYSWDFVAKTIANVEKISDQWKYITPASPSSTQPLSFQGVTISGQLPTCVSSVCTSATPNLSVSGDRTAGKLILSYTIATKVACFSWATPRYDTDNLECTLIPPA